MCVEDFLVVYWRLIAAGRADEVRTRFPRTWPWGMDRLSTEQEGRVALQLLRRLGFTTDATDEWEALPDPLIVHRAGATGVAWSFDPDVAARYADELKVTVRHRTVRKADVLAYITRYGEQEVIIEPRAN